MPTTSLRDAAVRSLNRYERELVHGNPLISYWGRGGPERLRRLFERAQERWDLARSLSPAWVSRRWYPYEEASWCGLCEVSWRPEYLQRGVRVNSRERLNLCPECVEAEGVQSCNSCGDYCSDEFLETSRDGEPYCQFCGVPHSVDIPSYGRGYRPPAPPRDEPSYSIELEMESEEIEELVTGLERLQESEDIGWERDGSLDREKGLEVLISCYPSPSELGKAVDKVLQAASGTGTASWTAGTCGCHVNSNRWVREAGRHRRLGWTDATVARLLYCVRANWHALVEIAGRESVRWAPLPTCNDGSPMPLRSWAGGRGTGKYCCVRVGQDRLEWRLFRGTLNPLRLGLYLSAVRYLEDIALSSLPASRLGEVSRRALLDLLTVYNTERERARDRSTVRTVTSSIATLTGGAL